MTDYKVRKLAVEITKQYYGFCPEVDDIEITAALNLGDYYIYIQYRVKKYEQKYECSLNNSGEWAVTKL